MLQFQFLPFPDLTTPRLTLRRVVATDAPALFVMRSDPEIMRFIPRPLATSEADVLELIGHFDAGMESNTGINWGITYTGSPELLGVVGFVRTNPADHRAEIGYLLGASQHGKGIMSEAVRAVIDYGFREMHLHSIEAVIDPENTASKVLLERLGFVQEGYFKENGFYEGRYLDSMVYSLLVPIEFGQ